MVMMGMVDGRLVWARQRANTEGEGALHEKEKLLKETSFFGYSGVLFACVVILREQKMISCHGWRGEKAWELNPVKIFEPLVVQIQRQD
ncbi:hypothetical protein ACHAWX_004118 [Stephanocyclus meneghinianus]